MDTPKKQRRGFAAMDPEKLREIARMGGKSVPAAKRTFARDHKLASDAGRLGGLNLPDHKRVIGRKNVKKAQAAAIKRTFEILDKEDEYNG